MKKIIRLTESDLARIVRQVISESNTEPVEINCTEKTLNGYKMTYQMESYFCRPTTTISKDPRVQTTSQNRTEQVKIDCTKQTLNNMRLDDAMRKNFCPSFSDGDSEL